MSTYLKPRIALYKADAAIARGKAVKIGTDKQHVAVCSSTTDKSIGIAMTAATTAEDQIEVARVGGGAKGLAQNTLSAGMQVVSHTDGALKKAAAANDRVIGVALQDAVAGDLFDMDVSISQATAVES